MSIKNRVGHRGAGLLAFAWIDLLYGLSLLIIPAAEARRTPTFIWVSSILPLHAWAMIWLTVGLLLVVQAFVRVDWPGFMAAIGIKVVWGLMMLGGWLTGHLPRGYVAMALWLGMAGLVAVIASWSEPDRPAQ